MIESPRAGAPAPHQRAKEVKQYAEKVRATEEARPGPGGICTYSGADRHRGYPDPHLPRYQGEPNLLQNRLRPRIRRVLFTRRTTTADNGNGKTILYLRSL